MESTCPQCSQLLRVPDGLTNPLLRCPKCRHQYRLSSAKCAETVPPQTEQRRPNPAAGPTNSNSTPASSPEEQAAAWREFVASHRKSAEAATPTSSPRGKFGMGWVGFIVLFALVKIGPRLAREFGRQKQPPPAPVRMNDQQQQAIEKLLRDLPDPQAPRLRQRVQPAAQDPGADPARPAPAENQ